MPKSPMILLGITIPLVMFMMILVMGYSFLSDHTDSTSRMHPPEHPLHGIANPNSMPVVKRTHQKSMTNNNKLDEINPKQQHQQQPQQPPSSEMKRLPREKGKVQPIGTDNVEYHIVFSTGCSAFQDWQSYVFFYQAMKVQQPGTVTRIVSGCNETEQATLQQIFVDTIAPMSPRFKIHFTPDFAKILKPGINYPYFNKPCGMKHWLEQILGFPNNPINEDSIVILLDPDQAIMRPFTRNDFSNTAWLHLKDPHHVYTQIMHGAPMGQRYGFYLQWKDKVRMSYVLNDETQTSPVDALSTKDANSGYVVGPPYIATARDMYAICDLWCQFAPRVHGEYRHVYFKLRRRRHACSSFLVGFPLQNCFCDHRRISGKNLNYFPANTQKVLPHLTSCVAKCPKFVRARHVSGSTCSLKCLPIVWRRLIWNSLIKRQQALWFQVPVLGPEKDGAM